MAHFVTGAAPVGLLAVGLTFKYVKEAFDWKEDGEEPLKEVVA